MGAARKVGTVEREGFSGALPPDPRRDEVPEQAMSARESRSGSRMPLCLTKTALLFLLNRA